MRSSKLILLGIVLMCLGGLCVCVGQIVRISDANAKRKERINRCVVLEIGTSDECEFTLRSIGPEAFDAMIHENEAAKWQIGGPGR